MNINFNKGNGLVPVIVQDNNTMQVLMLGYMNKEAFELTKSSNKVTFYSRSKQRLWTKGESSGHHLQVVNIQLDCDGDTLLIAAHPNGPTCHTGSSTCFGEPSAKGFLYKLESIIDDRISNKTVGSYTSQLYERGINKVAQKVGEEAVELVIEAKDDNEQLFNNEAADLLYHLLLLLRKKETSLEAVEEILMERFKAKK